MLLLSFFLISFGNTKDGINENLDVLDKYLEDKGFDDDIFKNILVASFTSVSETSLPQKISMNEIDAIWPSITKKINSIKNSEKINQTFNIMLRQELSSQKIYFTSPDISIIENSIWNNILSNPDIKSLILNASELIRHTNPKIYSKISGKTTPKSTKNPSKEPPFSIRNLLQFAWGLTMNFSHEDSQKTIGNKFFDFTAGIWKRHGAEKLDIEKPLTGIFEQNERFVSDLTFSLTKTSRNLGFIRDNHTKFIDTKSKELENTQKLFDDLASATSISKEGAVSKIITFFGGGSIISYFSQFSESFGKKSETIVYPADSLERLEKLYEIAPEGNKTDVFSLIFKNVTESDPIAITRTSESAGDLTVIFILAGIGVMLLSNLVFVIIRHARSKSIRKNIEHDQTTYWKNNFIPEASEHLYFFYQDLLVMINKHYGPEIKDRMAREFRASLNDLEFNANSLKIPSHLQNHFEHNDDDKHILYFLQNKVIPHYHFSHDEEWPIYLDENTYRDFVIRNRGVDSNVAIRKYLDNE